MHNNLISYDSDNKIKALKSFGDFKLLQLNFLELNFRYDKIFMDF